MTPAQIDAVVEAANEAFWEIMAKRDVKSTDAMIESASDCMKAAIIAALRELARQHENDFLDQETTPTCNGLADELEGK